MIEVRNSYPPPVGINLFGARRATNDDLKLVQQFRNDEISLKMLSLGKPPFSDVQTLEFIEKNFLYLCFLDKCLINWCENAESVEIPIYVLKQHRGKGIATMVLRDLTLFYGEKNFRARILPENIASIKLHEKVGFVRKKEVVFKSKTLLLYELGRES